MSVNVIERFQEGLTLLNEGSLNQALAVFTTLSKNFPEDLEDKIFKIMTFKSIAGIYTLKEDWENAIMYYQKAYAFYEESGNINEKINTLLSLGNLYADKNDLEKTTEYFERVVDLYDETENLEKATVYIDLGVIYLDQNQFGKALDYFGIALKIHERTSSKSELISILMDVGKVFLEKGNVLYSNNHFEKKKYRSCTEYTDFKVR